MLEKGYYGSKILKTGFERFAAKYSRPLSIVILILLLLLAGILRFEQVISTGLSSDAEEVMAEQEVGESTKAEKELTEYEPETCIEIMQINGSEATVRLFSTTEIKQESNYDLYLIEKKDGEWERHAYIRTINMPAADKIRNGKYRYYSDAVKVEWLSGDTIYQLIPHDEDHNHSSVPFWTSLS